MRRRARAISRSGSAAGLAVALLALGLAAGSFAADAVAADDPVAVDETMYTGDPITIRVKERRLIEVFRIFADESSLSIAADEDVLRRIVRFGAENEPWDRALDRVMSAEGLSWQLSGGTLLIEPREASLPLRRQGCFERPSADPARPDCVVVSVAVGSLDPGELASPCCDATLDLAVDPETTREVWILSPGLRSRKDLLKIRVVRGDSPWPADLKVSVTRGSSSICVEGLIAGSAEPILLSAESDDAEAVYVQVSAELPRP